MDQSYAVRLTGSSNEVRVFAGCLLLLLPRQLQLLLLRQLLLLLLQLQLLLLRQLRLAAAARQIAGYKASCLLAHSKDCVYSNVYNNGEEEGCPDLAHPGCGYGPPFC
jgi:hypothetical protein